MNSRLETKSVLNKNRMFYLAILFVFLTTFVPSVSAQDGVETGPVYIVQPGDTLSIIANRFGLSLSDIIAANEISNPDNVLVGTPLVLPGVDWVEGTIYSFSVPVGETFRSLRRRFDVDPSTLARLGGIVSPSQVYAGYPLMIASDGGEDFQSGRVVVSAESSLLELAAAKGDNPWSIATHNLLASPVYGIPGDVLLLPGTNDPGPGALPSPLAVEVSKGNFMQGKTTVIEVSAGGQAVQLEGVLADRPLTFFDLGDGSYAALQGVHAMTPPGPIPLVIRGQLADGSEFEFAQNVAVLDGGYESEKIRVDPAKLDPALDSSEFEYITLVTAPVTPEKLWSGVFLYPSPLEYFINSHFGTRRSYNDSPYDYFHSGTDLGGGSGTEVLAPARGRVVFTGELAIRGNATIIDHGWGIYTGYWHQSEILVNVGDIVERGQVIGRVGNTGRSSGAHLHWEVWAGGVQVEPLDWMYELYP